MLEIEGLAAGYGKVPVLLDMSLSVAKGQLTVISGPNGHGKTTLLRVISGLIPVRAGTVSFSGTDLGRLTAAEIVELGLVHIPQGDLLYGDMTVEQNLLMGAFSKKAWVHRTSELERVFALFPRLKERRKQQARTLSGGERRMCGIGRGLMNPASLLMVDEPALGLAPVLVEEVYSSLAKIAESDATAVIVEENLEHIRSIADYVYVIENGSVAAHGTLTDLAAHGMLQNVYLGL